jgi:hypothetical protein
MSALKLEQELSMVSLVSIPYDPDSKPGTWMYATWQQGNSPAIRCPNGHGSVMGNHVMEADGTSKGSVQCPVCDWHVYVKLEGWKQEAPNDDVMKSIVEMERGELERFAYTMSREQDNLHRLLNLIPPCPHHGNLCVSHAADWIMLQLAKETKTNE